MPEPAAASSLTRHPSFVLFWCARTFTNGAYMMQGVAVGWQIYELTNDPFDLGLVGLVQFVPLVVLSVVIGQVADKTTSGTNCTSPTRPRSNGSLVSS